MGTFCTHLKGAFYLLMIKKSQQPEPPGSALVNREPSHLGFNLATTLSLVHWRDFPQLMGLNKHDSAQGRQNSRPLPVGQGILQVDHEHGVSIPSLSPQVCSMQYLPQKGHCLTLTRPSPLVCILRYPEYPKY